MQVPLQLTFHDIDSSEAIEAKIRERATKLEEFSDRITSCRIVVEAPHRRNHKGRLYVVRIDVSLPGADIVVNREPQLNHAHEDVYVAIRDAFNAAQRQIQDYVRRRRGQVKAHEAPGHGRVIRLFPAQGYGFIRTADGREIYFHSNSVVNGAFDKLEVGSEVRVVEAEGEGEKGPQASTVKLIGKHHIVE